jgi:hypothetical protein
MPEVREEIRELILMWSLNGSEWPDELADDILAIPAIAEGQRLRVKYEAQRRTVELERNCETRTHSSPQER